MKINKMIYLAFIVCTLGGCTDDFEEINRDKKNPVEVNVEYLIPNVEHNLANQIASTMNVSNNISSILCQHVSRFQYIEPTLWDIRGELSNSFSSSCYSDLIELQEAILTIQKIDDLEAEKLLKAEKLLMLSTLSAYVWQILTDTFGSTPYSEALNILNIQPKFNTQQQIYLGELEKLSQAIKNAKREGNVFGVQDIIYNGSVEKWYKFANSLLLRMAMRISDIDTENSVKYANQAISGVFESNSDNALLQYLSTAGKWNPVYDIYRYSPPAECASTTMIELLKANSDPRLPVFWAPNASGDYSGNDFGVAISNTFSFFNQERMYDTGREEQGKIDLPAIFMDYAEVEFFLAEAVLRGGYNVSGSAESHFMAGVRASLEYWDIEEELISTYLNAALQRFNSATNKMRIVAEEKWVALITQGNEAWAEVRRLDYPVMRVPLGLSEEDYPTRLQFAPNDYSFNRVNVQVAAEQIGGDEQFVKLWWDVN